MSFEEFAVRWIIELVLFTMGGMGVLTLAALAFTAVMHYAPPWGHHEE